MARASLSTWPLKKYKHLTKYTIFNIYDELRGHIVGSNRPLILNNLNDALALASRFRDVIYKYPFFKKKHLRILRAIIDRCGEAYYKQDVLKLYITKEVIKEWAYSFQIPLDRIHEYLDPFIKFCILESSDRQGYIYKISSDFFRLIGPLARYLVVPVDIRRFVEIMAVMSGVSSVYVMAKTAKIPWFVKLSMIYTFSGLNPDTMRVNQVLEIQRINYVDEYFIFKKNFPVEWWRSIRMEAFEYMTGNMVIEDVVPHGYRLNALWVRMHEAGARRYVERLRERYRSEYRGY